MLAWSFVGTVAVGVAGAALAISTVTACVVQSEPSNDFSGGGGSNGGGSGSGGSAQPMLVDVDPNQTMNAAPGDGVGVFVEYKTGGHWNVWWTCDTNKTQLGCSFDNTITVSTGTITNLAGQQLEASDSLTQASPQSVEAITETTTGVDGITFDTPFSYGQTPVITLNAKLNGVTSAQYACANSTGEGSLCNVLFFVQDGEIDGNYQGQLTDPLMLEPKTP